MHDVILMVLQQQWEELPVKVGFTHTRLKCWATCDNAEETQKMIRVISDLSLNSLKVCYVKLCSFSVFAEKVREYVIGGFIMAGNLVLPVRPNVWSNVGEVWR